MLLYYYTFTCTLNLSINDFLGISTGTYVTHKMHFIPGKDIIGCITQRIDLVG